MTDQPRLKRKDLQAEIDRLRTVIEAFCDNVSADERQTKHVTLLVGKAEWMALKAAQKPKPWELPSVITYVTNHPLPMRQP